MKAPQGCKTDEYAQSNRFCFDQIRAFAFQKVFFNKAFKAFLPDIPVKNLLTLNAVFYEILHRRKSVVNLGVKLWSMAVSDFVSGVGN